MSALHAPMPAPMPEPPIVAASEHRPIDPTRERAHYWRSVGGLELLRARFVTHAFTPHTHETFAMGVIESGAERFTYRHAAHVAPTGSVVLINPGEVHTGASAMAGGWRYRMFYPAPALLAEMATEMTGHLRPVPFFAEAVVADPALAAALAHLHATLEGDEADALERESLLVATFAAMVARHADTPHVPQPPRPEPMAVARVRAHLREHADEAVSLADLAALTGLSPYHLVRTFRAATGLPPHAYLTQVRVFEAKRLLAVGLAPAEVAARVGFHDQAHLTRHFKRVVGVPPAQYAQAVR